MFDLGYCPVCREQYLKEIDGRFSRLHKMVGELKKIPFTVDELSAVGELEKVLGRAERRIKSQFD